MDYRGPIIKEEGGLGKGCLIAIIAVALAVVVAVGLFCSCILFGD